MLSEILSNPARPSSSHSGFVTSYRGAEPRQISTRPRIFLSRQYLTRPRWKLSPAKMKTAGSDRLNAPHSRANRPVQVVAGL
jgi:hypothetical protein